MRKNMKLEQDIVSVEEFMLEQETDFQTIQDDIATDEQPETKWNNKKKISKKTIILRVIISFVILGIIGFGSWFFLLGNQAKADSDEVAIVLESGQELVIGEITSIIGNEVTMDLVEEEIVDTSTQTGSSTTGPSGMEMPEGMEMPADGEMPEGMEMPADGEMPSGDMPSDMQMPSGMEMPDAQGTDTTTTDTTEATTSEDTASEDTVEEEAAAVADTTVTYYNSLGESKSLQIPVGTEVITKLGTVTTFSRLAVGDVIKVIMGSSGSDSYIVRIYIVD